MNARLGYKEDRAAPQESAEGSIHGNHRGTSAQPRGQARGACTSVLTHPTSAQPFGRVEHPRYHAIQAGLPAVAGEFGAAYAIPIIYVPVLMITHFIAFYLLVRQQPHSATAHSPAGEARRPASPGRYPPGPAPTESA
jgi:hypothetical protein